MSAGTTPGLSKHFGEVRAVDDLDLDIADGEFFSMLGPSGSGKTTVLRLLAGFERPTDGRILLGEEDVTDLPAHRRDVNTVFQDYAIFPHMDVVTNVEYGLRVKKVDRKERRDRAEEALAAVRLEGYGERRPNQLSGGQRQRVALARALVNRPKVLLLDEPLGALDLKLRREMQIELKQIQREVGITFVFVTHDQEEALSMSDRVAVFNDGRVEQVATPIELYEHPASPFVAGFVGTSNRIHGDAARGSSAPPATSRSGPRSCASYRAGAGARRRRDRGARQGPRGRLPRPQHPRHRRARRRPSLTVSRPNTGGATTRRPPLEAADQPVAVALHRDSLITLSGATEKTRRQHDHQSQEVPRSRGSARPRGARPVARLRLVGAATPRRRAAGRSSRPTCRCSSRWARWRARSTSWPGPATPRTAQRPQGRLGHAVRAGRPAARRT